MNLEITLKTGGETPIYEQIEKQIREQIISGRLAAGQPVPSIRSLAKMLHVSVITVQKAYEQLRMQGLIESAVGRGTVVAEISREALLETKRKKLEQVLREAAGLARECGLDRQELMNLLSFLVEEDE